MNDYKKIALVGGDARSLEVCRMLADAGHEVAAWGFGSIALPSFAVRVRDISDALKNSRAVILPLPVSGDSVTLQAPLSGREPQRLDALFDLVPADALVLGGRFPPAVKAMLEERSLRFIDYFELEEFQIKNAVPTAEGALAIAINEFPSTIRGSSCAVCGFGRIGKLLARSLKSLGAQVTVTARKSADLAWISALGYEAVKTSPTMPISGCEVIFNTVPARIFDRALLSRLSADALVIDLASSPGGVDPAAARELGIKCIHASALPGKTAPRTAGRIIGECVSDILQKRGIVP